MKPAVVPGSIGCRMDSPWEQTSSRIPMPKPTRRTQNPKRETQIKWASVGIRWRGPGGIHPPDGSGAAWLHGCGSLEFRGPKSLTAAVVHLSPGLGTPRSRAGTSSASS